PPPCYRVATLTIWASSKRLRTRLGLRQAQDDEKLVVASSELISTPHGREDRFGVQLTCGSTERGAPEPPHVWLLDSPCRARRALGDSARYLRCGCLPRDGVRLGLDGSRRWPPFPSSVRRHHRAHAWPVAPAAERS